MSNGNERLRGNGGRFRAKLEKPYFFGVVRDNGTKVGQVTDDVDGLSPEVLAEPGVLVFGGPPREEGLRLAQLYQCNVLELNLSDGYRMVDAGEKVVSHGTSPRVVR